jgi:serine/threonine-protein kinase
MPYLEGQTLAEELRARGGRLASARARYVVRQMALGLSALHEQNIVHHDIKPLDTVITADDDVVKLLDFGIARFLDYTSLTEHGRMMGTIAYAAPEQLRGDAVPSSDLYSLWVTLCELLTGQLPFGGDLVALVRAIQEDIPDPPSALKPGGFRATLTSWSWRCLRRSRCIVPLPPPRLATSCGRGWRGFPIT